MIKWFQNFLLESKILKDFFKVENVCYNCGSKNLNWGHWSDDLPNNRFRRHYNCNNCDEIGVLTYKTEFLNNESKYFDEYMTKLDKFIENKDYEGFIEYYNNPKYLRGADINLNKYKERYKKRRPENIDIIDGANIGLFGLKK